MWRPGAKPDMANGIKKRLIADGPIAVKPRNGDKYVVVDERLYGKVTLAVADWPGSDRGGRLRFGPSSAMTVDEKALHRAIAKHRETQGDVDRPLRIGDCFLVRGMKGAPGRWTLIVDVSADAREQAKIALFAAAAPLGSMEDLQRADEELTTPTSPSQIANPAI